MKRGVFAFCFIVISALLLFVGASLKAQNKQLIDSLENELKREVNAKKLRTNIGSSQTDTSIILALLQLSKAQTNYNPKQALEYTNQAIEMAGRIGFKKGLASAYNLLGIFNRDKGNYHQAIDFHKRALGYSFALNDKKKIAESYNGLGVVYKELGKFPTALKYHFQSLKIKEEIDDEKGIAHSYGNIGIVYRLQGDYKNALKFQLLSLKVREKLKDKEGIANCLSNLGSVYSNQGNYPEAISCHLKALKIREEVGDKRGKAISLGNIGVALHIQGKYEDALKKYYSSILILEELEDKKGIALMMQNIAKSLTLLKRYSEAYFYLIKGLSISKEIGNLGLIKGGYGFMTELDNASGNYKSALENMKLYFNYRDSLSNQEGAMEMEQTQMQYEYDKKEAIKSAEQEKKNVLAKREIEKQKLLRNSFIGGFILLTLIAIGVFRSLKQNRKAKAIITHQKELVEEKNKEIVASIEYAKRLQNAILPATKLVKEYLVDSFIFYRPKDIVAGDFYWFYPTKNKEDETIILFAAADCTGHGVPGAMVSVVCANALNKAVKELHLQEPGKILDAVSDFVEETFMKSNSTQDDAVQDGMDISLCALNLSTLLLQWSGANNSLVIIQNTSIQQTNNSMAQQLKELKPDKQPIGLFKNRKAFSTQTLQLQKNEILYLFSDGYADQFGGNAGKKLLKKNLKNFLLSISALTIEKQLSEFETHFDIWKGSNDQVDDVCVIGVRV